MDVKVIKKEESKLFPRVEGIFKVDFAGKTPSRLEVKAEVSKFLGVNTDLVVIKEIKSIYGENTCVVKARVYMDKNALKKLEPEYTLKRNQLINKEKGNAEKKEEGKSEQKKEEAAEQKKENKSEQKNSENTEKEKEISGHKKEEKSEQNKEQKTQENK